MQRLLKVDRWQFSVRDSWVKIWSPQICAQASIERHKNKKLSVIMKEFGTDDGKLRFVKKKNS